MTFYSTILKWTEDIKKSSDEIVREIIIDVGVTIIQLTPAKTGNLKGNWNFSVTTPNTATDLGKADKSGQQAIADLVNKVGRMTAGQVGYFTNYVHYGETIEHGGSPRKAPKGMFRISTTEEKFREALDKALANNIV